MKKILILSLLLTLFVVTTQNASAISDNDSGWPECNGWATKPNYDKHACRIQALKRAENSGFYAAGLPTPPSGIKDWRKSGATNGSDQAWYNWGGWNGKNAQGKHFLSTGTRCGIGPSVCVPTPTPTPTRVPTPTPTRVPTPTPTRVPTPTPTPTDVEKVCALGDRVVLDTNRNGVQDANENGIANVKVELLTVNHDVVKTTHTDSNGYYRFNNLKCKSYQVRFVKPAGYTFSTPFVGDSKKDSNANVTNGLSDKINLRGVNLTVDALLYRQEATPTPTPTVTVTPTPTASVTPTVTPTRQATPTAAVLGDVKKLPETGSAWEILGLLSGLTIAAGAGLSELIKRA